MQMLKRNQRIFYYALYEGKTPIVDEYGNVTGEYIIQRGHPNSYKANISSATGETSTRLFGENESYDKVIVLSNDDVAEQIDEYTVLWVDTFPELDEEGNTETPYDYIVKKVSRSLNSTALAIAKVKVDV